MRIGFAAGDRKFLARFLELRNVAAPQVPMPAQRVAIAAYADEDHVVENRRLYAEKFRAALPLVRKPLECAMPEGAFYLWMRTPIDDAEFARRLHAQYNVLVLPGSFLARTVRGVNPGANHLRLALVPPLAECVEAMERIMHLAGSL